MCHADLDSLTLGLSTRTVHLLCLPRHLDQFDVMPSIKTARSVGPVCLNMELLSGGQKHAGGSVGGLPRTRRRSVHDSRNLMSANGSVVRETRYEVAVGG